MSSSECITNTVETSIPKQRTETMPDRSQAKVRKALAEISDGDIIANWTVISVESGVPVTYETVWDDNDHEWTRIRGDVNSEIIQRGIAYAFLLRCGRCGKTVWRDGRYGLKYPFNAKTCEYCKDSQHVMSVA